MKTLGYCCRMEQYYGDGSLHQQIEKLKCVHGYGNHDNSLLVALVNIRQRLAVENLLRWGVLDCSDKWAELISLCIRLRSPIMLNALVQNDRSRIPSNISEHMEVFSNNLGFEHLNSLKTERIVRILIKANFSFYGVKYAVAFDDTIAKLMLLHFVGVEITDVDNVRLRSLTYINSLTARSLRKLPLEFGSVSEAVMFARCMIKNHQPKRLSFLCKLHIRKYLGPCQKEDILKDRVDLLPVPGVIKTFLGSSFI